MVSKKKKKSKTIKEKKKKIPTIWVRRSVAKISISVSEWDLIYKKSSLITYFIIYLPRQWKTLTSTEKEILIVYKES